MTLVSNFVRGNGMRLPHFWLFAPMMFVVALMVTFLGVYGFGKSLQPGSSYDVNATDFTTTALKAMYQFSQGYNNVTVGVFLFICCVGVVFFGAYLVVNWKPESEENRD
jgi:hypothetical protein